MDEFAAMASGGSFYQLPDELLLKIFSYLDIPDLVLNIQHVDSHWKAIVQDVSFWKEYVFTFDEKVTDKEIILLLKNMPCLRALTAKRGATNKLVHTVCNTCKFLTHIELHQDHKISTVCLKNIAKHLPHIQHLGMPLSWTESNNASEYSMLIQQFHDLLSLRLIGYGFEANDSFLSGIANECPLLHEIDLAGHHFQIEDVTSFLEAKITVLTRFFTRRTNSTQMMLLLATCKHLEVLHFEYREETLPRTLSLDLPNLKHLGINEYDEEQFSTISRCLQKTTMLHLEKLDLGSGNLNAVQFEAILKNCLNLKSLVLRFCHLPNGDDFQHIWKCTNLEYLEIPHTVITDLAVEIFSAKCTKLHHLDMDYCPMITDHSLSCLKNCTALQVLKLNGTQITGQNFHLLPLHQTKLRELHIEQCDQLDYQYVKSLQEEMQQLKVFVSKEMIPESSEDFVDLMETSIFTELC